MAPLPNSGPNERSVRGRSPDRTPPSLQGIKLPISPKACEGMFRTEFATAIQGLLSGPQPYPTASFASSPLECRAPHLGGNFVWPNSCSYSIYFTNKMPFPVHMLVAL